MNLPDDPATRNKVLGGIVAGLVLFTVGSFVAAKKWHSALSATRGEIALVEEKIEKAGKTRKLMPKLESDHEERTDKLRAMAETQQILQPLFEGSSIYLEKAKTITFDALKKNRAVITSISRVGTGSARQGAVDYPAFYGPLVTGEVPIPPTDQGYQIYTISLAVQADLANIADMIKTLETANPYLAITKLEIRSGTENPTQHSVIMRVTWPVFRYRDQVRDWIAEKVEDEIPVTAPEAEDNNSVSTATTGSRQGAPSS